MDYSNMKTSELRELIRERNLASGRAVVFANKENCIKLLNGEISALPEPSTGMPHQPEFFGPTNSEAQQTIITTPAAKPATLNAMKEGDALGVLKALGQLMGAGSIDAEGVKKLINEYLTSKEGIELIKQNAIINHTLVSVDRATPVEIEGQTHEKFQTVLHLATAGLPILLVGPAGTGKTHLAKQVSEALKRPFTYNSMSAGVTESHLTGRTLPQPDGSWKFETSPFIKTYENGGVHLFDELDAADANVLTFLNAALANGHLSVPQAGRIFEKHPDTVIICAANTFGTGATRQYVGRNQLDVATLDRFAVSTVFIDYDKKLEETIARSYLGNTALLEKLWKVRECVELNHMRRIVSTRSIKNFHALMQTGGIEEREVWKMFLSSWSEEERRKAERAINL